MFWCPLVQFIVLVALYMLFLYFLGPLFVLLLYNLVWGPCSSIYIGLQNICMFMVPLKYIVYVLLHSNFKKMVCPLKYFCINGDIFCGIALFLMVMVSLKYLFMFWYHPEIFQCVTYWPIRHENVGTITQCSTNMSDQSLLSNLKLRTSA